MVWHALLNRETPHPERPSAEVRPEGVLAIVDGMEHGNTQYSAELARSLDEVRLAMERNPDDARAAAVRLVTLLTPSSRPDPAIVRGGLAPWQKRKVDRYLRKNLARRVEVAELAMQIPLSVSHFRRAFISSFGTSPRRHITQLRLELVQRLMLTTEMALAQIALTSGLADQAHLSKFFRRELGETPSAWRRRSLTVAQAKARARSGAEPGELLDGAGHGPRSFQEGSAALSFRRDRSRMS